jgi:hypothetical protein
MGENGIKIGRISIKVEKALGISIAKNVEVAMPQEKIDGVAKAHPTDYLRMIDVAAQTIKKPDFVAMNEACDIAFVRIGVSEKNEFSGRVVIVRDRPSGFAFDSVGSLNLAEQPDVRLIGFGQLVRVDC